MEPPFLAAMTILLASTYGTYLAELKTMEILNGIRDTVLESVYRRQPTSSKAAHLAHLRLKVFGDWLTLAITNVVMLMMFAVGFWCLPMFCIATGPVAAALHTFRWIARGFAVVPVLGAIAWCVAGGMDFRAMQAALEKLDSPTPVVTLRPKKEKRTRLQLVAKKPQRFDRAA